MSLVTVGAVVGIAAGVNSLSGGAITNAVTGGGSSSTPQQTQSSADPYAAYRPAAAAEYANYMTPGGSADPTKMPGYSQFVSGVLNPALGSVQAMDSASGRGWSGQEATDLTKTASQNYYGFMQNYLTQLAQGSGAINNPAPAAQLGYQQQQSNQQGMMQGIGGIMQGTQTLYNNSNSNSSYSGVDGAGGMSLQEGGYPTDITAPTGYSGGP